MSGYVAIDIGGTFTDLVYFDEDRGLLLEKVATVPAEPAQGVTAAIDKAAINLGQVDRFFHGTTLGINTLLEGTGAPTGLITTAGFRDVLEIGRMNWPMYRLHWQKPEPLVPRRLRVEVRERITADGRILAHLSADDVLAAGEWFQGLGIASVAVSFINAYAHPQHEEEVAQLLGEHYPDLVVTLSHRLTREFREYERTCTTVIDAIIRPRLIRYLETLERTLVDRGLRSNLLVTRSDGGVMDVAAAHHASVRTLLSGPASGVMGASALAADLNLSKAIAADMGGTSFDAALILDGEPIVASSTQVEGFPLLMPVVELVTIGAGGGSIARIDSSGALEVGPSSAGADPGPISYGKGGQEPTVTDAALVAGLIDAESFLGGEITLDRDAAARGISEIAAQLGLSTDEAAAGIMDIAEAKMAATLEDLTVGRGLDPREFTLIAYGGGGPLVANALAARLEMAAVVIPPLPAAFSAWGMLTLDEVRDFAFTRIASLSDLNREGIKQTFNELEDQAVLAFDANEVPANRRRLVRSLDMRYENQEHSLTIRIASSGATPELLRPLFDAEHRAQYGYELADPVEVVTYRVRAVALLQRPPRLQLSARTNDATLKSKGSRRVHHRGSGGEGQWLLYDRAALKPGDVIPGPAVIEEPTATTPVLPGYTASVDAGGNVVLTRGGE
jgi:N-methylhydantoinase A